MINVRITADTDSDGGSEGDDQRRSYHELFPEHGGFFIDRYAVASGDADRTSLGPG